LTSCGNTDGSVGVGTGVDVGGGGVAVAVAGGSVLVGVGVNVGALVATGVAVADGGATLSNMTASKKASAGNADCGLSIRRMRAVLASGGASTGPVVINRNAFESLSRRNVESADSMLSPEASSLSYQEMRKKT
jgi:hypothetical protein